MLRREVLGNLQRRIAAVVVDDDDFDGIILGGDKLIDLGQAGGQTSLFIVSGYHDG